MNYLVAPERHEREGFVLRSYEPGDGALLAAAQNESYDHLRPWLAWAKPHTSVEEAEVSVRQFRGKYLLAQDFVIGIFSSDERRLLGGTGFHLREGPLSACSAEIGMFVRASAAGRGLGTAVLRAMLEWGFRDWPWLRLAWYCDENNLGSARVAERAGMMREGVLHGQPTAVGDGRRNTLCYGLTKNAWV